MVQTRRQSGKLSIPRYNEDDLSDEERVGGANGRRKIRRPNPKDGKLSILSSIPLDILFEIFTHLSPKDLLTLSRTSRILRSTLLSKNATTVWKRSLANMPGSPPACPKDISEARWAELLYGATNCHICGAVNIFNIDFSFRRRLCLSCKKTNLVYSSKFSKKFPEFDPLILDLIPYATISGSYPPNHKLHNKPPSKYFLESDIYSMAQTFGLLAKNIHMRKPGAKAKLEEFKKERAEFVKDVAEYAKVCEGWAVEENKRLSGLKDEAVTNRRNEIISRLRSLGYDQTDLNAISWSRFVHQYKDLTARSWNIMLPQLESELKERREARLRAERNQLIYNRKRLAASAYRNWKVKNIPRRDWPLLPQDFQVVAWEGFEGVIEAHSDVVVGEESFEEALGGLEEVIEKWKVDKKRKLVSLVPVGAPSSSSISEPHAGPQDVDTSPLDLATSIFACRRPCCKSIRCGGLPPVLGAAQLLSNTYPCFPFPISDGGSTPQVAAPFEFRFNEDLSRVAKSLVECIGGDVERMTMKDMDERDARFFCVSCSRVERSRLGEDDDQRQQRDEEKGLEVGWNIILPKLESEIQARREARARVERSQLIYSRRRLAGPAYRNWKVKNIPPKDWPLLPQDFQVVSWEGFDSVIEAASDVVVGEESFEGVLGGLEEVIEKWKVDKKRKLVSLVPVGTPSSSSISEPHAGPQDVDTSSLELATSIFICTRPYYSSVRYGGIPPVMGTAQLLSHTYPCFPFPISDGDSTTQVAPSFEFRFSEDLSSVAKSLVESVGGDVERIMMKDMDKRDARFFCVGCARVERSGPGEGDAQHQQRDEERRLEVGALSWRACINHFMTIHRTQEEHQDPSDFRLLPPILEEQAIAQECCEPDPSFGQSAWLCACCDCHVYRGTTRDGAITHVQTQHGVENPLEDEHFVFDSRITKLFRPPQIVRLDEEVMLGL
ncbi:hypothetical protein JAAARDRAFT_31404 [Jaapia argillacea MUCL 33604]|uniref:F-box domain-containing protein n=1 Tax=Jaapia argillacea MUCL 33604 TaxID=933084 RepID=A0A067Q4E9_9AGAM|nr:hypothetical protein JAAARDRAFT_31404 [Jaapia argillacea MUCL 33604]